MEGLAVLEQAEKSWQEQRNQRENGLQQEMEHLLAQQEEDELDQVVIAKIKAMGMEKYSELFAVAKEATIKKIPFGSKLGRRDDPRAG